MQINVSEPYKPPTGICIECKAYGECCEIGPDGNLVCLKCIDFMNSQVFLDSSFCLANTEK